MAQSGFSTFPELLFLEKDSPKTFYGQKAEQQLRMWNLTSDGSSGVPFLTLTSYVTLGKFPNLYKTVSSSGKWDSAKGTKD